MVAESLDAPVVFTYKHSTMRPTLIEVPTAQDEPQAQPWMARETRRDTI